MIVGDGTKRSLLFKNKNMFFHTGNYFLSLLSSSLSFSIGFGVIKFPKTILSCSLGLKILTSKFKSKRKEMVQTQKEDRFYRYLLNK